MNESLIKFSQTIQAKDSLILLYFSQRTISLQLNYSILFSYLSSSGGTRGERKKNGASLLCLDSPFFSFSLETLYDSLQFS